MHRDALQLWVTSLRKVILLFLRLDRAGDTHFNMCSSVSRSPARAWCSTWHVPNTSRAAAALRLSGQLSHCVGIIFMFPTSMRGTNKSKRGSKMLPLCYDWKKNKHVCVKSSLWWCAGQTGRVPGGGGGLSRLPLDLRLLAELLPQSCLHLGRDVWRSLADLHGRLQQLDGAPSVHLHFHRVLLLHLRCFALIDRCSVGRRHLGETHAEAILHVGGQSLAPPNGPAQLPKDKERDYQQGEATETHDHSKETNRDVYMSPWRDP